MRHTFFSISLASLIMLSVSGCTEIFRHDGTEEGLKITISCGPQTKATRDGVGNENLIKTVDVFLFPDVEGADGKYTTRFHEEPEVSTDYTMYIGSAFASEARYTVFTIVNYPYSSLSDLDSAFGVNSDAATKKTIAELQALALSESSHRTFTGIRFGDKIYPANEEDLALVMTGQTSVTTTSPIGNVLGEASINLKRLAAKVTMDIYLEDVLDFKGDGSEIWTPITDGSAIRAYLCNANEETRLDGTINTPSLFDYEPNSDMAPISGKTGFSAAYTIPAFYTYPETWTEGDANEPYIKLIVQWQLARTTSAGTFTSQKETYYKVKLPISASTGFESNHWYNLQLDVTQLGGSSQNEAVPIIPSYQVANWGSTSFMLSTLIRSYYLGIAEANKNLKIYTDKVEIPFTSSGNVSFTTTIESTDFFLNTTVTHDNDTENWVSLDNVNNILTINRPIRENFPIEYDVSPYDFSITLHLVDELGTTDFDQVVHVTQYPPLYLSSQDTKVGITNGERNKKPTVIINKTKPNESGTTSKDVWDNTGITTKSVANHSHYLGTVAVPTAVLNASSNNSPYLYTVTATNIDLKVSYDGGLFDAVIGDPRGNPVNYDSASGEKLSGGDDSNVLTNYRPTNGNSKNIIAPQFMCASSYGKTSAVSYEGAVKRCAAYQEYGYPAGRWRLPTAAEVAFLQKLNADSKIPSMFAASSTGSQILGYWTAGKELYTTEGFVNLTDAALDYSDAYQYAISGATKPYRGFVRCVYDTWYWGDTKSATTNSEWLKYKPNLSDTF